MNFIEDEAYKYMKQLKNVRPLTDKMVRMLLDLTDFLNTNTVTATASAGATADVGVVENTSEVVFKSLYHEGTRATRGLLVLKALLETRLI